MSVVVFGYHDVGCACLQALFDLGVRVSLVVTHTDDPDENIWFGSVASLARARGVPVATPEDANAPEFVERIRALRPAFFLSCYYRQILSPELLAIPGGGAFNMHGSLLPGFRGRAPVNWVLVKGESVTGVTLHVMTDKPDRGDIVGQRAVPIEDADTALTLHRKCAAAAGELMREVWPRIEAGTAPRTPQDPALASYFGRRRPADGRIDWSAPARTCWNLVRAVTHPYPGAFTHARGKKLLIWKASLRSEYAPNPAAAEGSGAPAETARSGSPAETSRAGAQAGTARTGAPSPPSAPGVPSMPTGFATPSVHPGTLAAVVPGAGVLVATGQGSLLIESVQLEGHEEMRADELAAKGLLSVGERLA